MVKFFLCYAWLGIGFLVAFKIFFSDERVFEGFPIPLVTMLVWMLGELEYADKLFPEDVKLNLLKKVVELNGTNEKHYTGIEESENGYLQFAGKFFLKQEKLHSIMTGISTYSCRNCPLFLCCLRHSVLHHHHEPAHWPGRQ